MSKVSLSGNASGTGTFTIASPNSNVDRTLNLPDASGTILTTATPGVPVNGPAFTAYGSSTQTLTSGVFTKVAYNTEESDTNSNYDNAAYRFTPTVAGFYQVSAQAIFGAGTGVTYMSLYKNAGLFRYLQSGSLSTSGSSVLGGSTLLYMNGSTDYVEIYIYQSSGGSVAGCGSGSANFGFQAFLARSAT